ncbi:MAG TPA: FmdB family zinc ribbon protein [Nakamurella sp.]
MPTYQYACTDCGHRFEAVQAFTDDSLTTCPVCSGQLRKVYGSVGVVFKGSGFYRTDSRNGMAASTAATGSDNRTDSKTESKPAAKSDSSGGSSDSKPAAATTSSGSSSSSATKAAS